MADKDISLDELRAQAAKAREAWSKIPIADILQAVSSDLQGEHSKALIQELRPLFEALPAEDPIKQPLGSLIGIMTSLPSLITQRLDQLNRQS